MISDNLQSLYPDLAARGGLTPALQGALTAIGSTLTVSGLRGVTNFVVYARVEAGSRFSQIYIAAQKRLFLFDCWSRGVMLATGKTPSLTEMARAIDTWVDSRCSTADLAAAFDFVTVEPCAQSYERGEEVEHRWQSYLASIGDHYPELTAFVEAAARRPPLRQLFPFTSLNTFCFSRCTGYPFTRDTPSVKPLGNGQYEVVNSTGRPVGRGTADVAAALVVANLPLNCGPAVPGTADDWGVG